MPFKLLITDVVFEPDIEQEILGDGVEISTETVEGQHAPDAVYSAADALMCYHTLEFPPEIIRKLTNCKIISRVGVGYDNICLQTAADMGILVCNVPDYGTNEVADHAIGLMLALCRGIPQINEATRKGGYDFAAFGKLPRLWDRKFAVVGLGRIGTATALRAKAFGLDVCFHDPYLPDGVDKALGITRYTDLYEMVAAADIISIHTPLTVETRNLVNAEFVATMKDDAYLINTARGPIVDVDAVGDALKAGRFGGVGIDVWPTEPPQDEALMTAWRAREPWTDRLLVTAHAAFFSGAGIREIREKATLEVKRVLNDEPPRNCVNVDLLTHARIGDEMLARVKRLKEGPPPG
jgi:lactate dehydrogenase-like 2-hydroxyacid dehydrogenase